MPPASGVLKSATGSGYLFTSSGRRSYIALTPISPSGLIENTPHQVARSVERQIRQNQGRRSSALERRHEELPSGQETSEGGSTTQSIRVP